MGKKILPMSDDPDYKASYASLLSSRSWLTYVTLAYVLGLSDGKGADPQHEMAPRNFLAGQEKVWNILLLLDTLYVAMLLPLFIEGGFAPPDCVCALNATGCGCMSESLAAGLSVGYDMLLCGAVVVIVLHTELVIVLYIGASYVVMMPAPTIKRFLVRFKVPLFIGNVGLLPATAMILLAAAVAYVLTRGVTVGAVVVMVLFGSTAVFANIAIMWIVFTPLKALVVQDLDALAE